jgi:hypothetical protein
MSDPSPFWLPRMHIKRTLLTHLCSSFRENRSTGSWKKAVVARESLYHYYLTMTVYGVWVINKAGGLIFQRNYGGKPFPSPHLARPTIDSRLPPPLPVPSTPPSWLPHRLQKAGIAQLSSNEYLVMAGTLHGVHAITSRIAPVPKSSGVQIIEAESFKMTIHMTLTGTLRSPSVRWSQGTVANVTAGRYQVCPDLLRRHGQRGIHPPKDLRSL